MGLSTSVTQGKKRDGGMEAGVRVVTGTGWLGPRGTTLITSFMPSCIHHGNLHAFTGLVCHEDKSVQLTKGESIILYRLHIWSMDHSVSWYLPVQ